MGVKVSDRITTFSETDIYATGDSNRQALGFHAVDSLAERNQITYDRRRGSYQEEGETPKPFFVSVRLDDDVKLYWLKNEPGEGDTEDTDWEEFIAGYEEPFQGFFIPNSSTLVDGTGVKGQYWIASVGGTFNSETYVQYDKTIYDGSVWKKIGGGTVVGDWTTMINKPSSFTPTTHNHPIVEVSGLQTALDNKVDSAKIENKVSTATDRIPSSAGVQAFTYSKGEVDTKISNLSTYGIKYAWLNSALMSSQTGQLSGDLGLREDEQKVYKWSGTAWIYFFTVAANTPLATATNDGLMSKEDKASLGVNNIRTGLNSFTIGDGNTASGLDATASGFQSIASGAWSKAHGYQCEASGESSVATGERTKATGFQTYAGNISTTASNQAAHAEGWYTTASGKYGSHSEGDSTTASGKSSHAQNYHTKAIGNYSYAGGIRARATGEGSFNHSTSISIDPTINIGASGDNSAVLAGLNNAATALNSATIAGNGLINNVPNSLLVPKLIVSTGIITNMAGDNLLSNIGFVAVTENQFGTHPAFATLMEFVEYVLSNGITPTPITPAAPTFVSQNDTTNEFKANVVTGYTDLSDYEIEIIED